VRTVWVIVETGGKINPRLGPMNTGSGCLWKQALRGVFYIHLEVSGPFPIDNRESGDKTGEVRKGQPVSLDLPSRKIADMR
jgi:hypothetical protein